MIMMQDTMSVQALSLRGGLRLPCAQFGDAGGMPVLLLHGYTDSWRSFELVLPHLLCGIRAVVPTQRGHGDAGRPECAYTPADFAADASAVLDALGIERAVVVGHSMG